MSSFTPANTPRTKTTRRVLAVASGGGHWVQLLRLRPAFAGAEIHYATVDAGARSTVAPAPVYVYPDANKDTKLRLIASTLALAVIMLRVRPHVVISTGAAGGYLAIRLARLMGARTVFIDSIANTRQLSVSGRLAQKAADLVLSQWPTVAAASGAQYRGAVL
ncbi:Oligosaccharide biosynthesis protein Alg14 like [Pseudorhodobacter antarcticus]|jgi:UDP-N-acetylglucosamine:LPS N-acetylglucosamine transferase|uniref:Oligosaccharide biosynthesis protein Alg14 like n=1 Tax=Pseudorhodobacter antarcticus TaxID=1077947 RepID=A0A1H8LIY8_9RHOB|nr:hypothetical protein [Pseudorhodobacter antarcticus]SEO04746.1 Oligosaccharide biosynthesis protein Alg14 like [Pseudorhodobacter antarcticus]